MSEEKPPAPRREGKARNKDIAPILKGWDFESGTINVRKIAGLDGHPKLQMRLNLGLLQMEMTGRPDGARPHGHESLLDYYETRLKEHTRNNGTELGFHLTSEECLLLREEGLMYYHRYLSLFVLEEFSGVVRDTDRNLRLLDLCARYAVDQQDRFVLEQYRPYTIMIHTRAAASILFKAKRYRPALTAVEEGLEKIRTFFANFGQQELFAASNEVKVLKRFARDIRRRLPVDPLRKLQARLDKAVRDEKYEEAAKLRDQIAAHRPAER